MSRTKTDPRGARRSVTRLTGRGVAFLVVGIGCGILSYTTRSTELQYAAGFVVLLPVAALIVVLARPLRLRVTRTFTPPVVSAGTSSVVELEVRNVSTRPSPPASWTDRVPWFPYVVGPGQLPRMRAQGVARTAQRSRSGYTIRPPLRGIYDIGPLDVTYSDPFGLAIGRLTVGGKQKLYVTPVAVPFGESGSISVSGEGSARLIQRMVTGNDDDLMTREYRIGDALRRVHWRASARHGELMVRQEEQRTYPGARVILDTRMDGYGGPISMIEFPDNGFTWFEWAVTMTASLGVHLHRSGFQVDVLETGPRQIAPFGDAKQGGRQDLEFLLSLAAVRLIDDRGRGSDAGEQPPSSLGPVFAVVADPTIDTLNWIIAQRRPYEPAVAFVLETGNESATEALRANGWLCVPVTDGSDPALAWAGVSRLSGAVPVQTMPAPRSTGARG